MDRHGMEWTRSKPTEPGWYWWSDEGAQSPPMIIEILWEDTVGSELVVWAEEQPGDLANWRGWFMGPLERPAPPHVEEETSV